jgi:hypothetical protein
VGGAVGGTGINGVSVVPVVVTQFVTPYLADTAPEVI